MKNWKPASILATPQLKVASVFQALASQQQRPMNTWAVYETWDCWNKFLPVKHQIYVEISDSHQITKLPETGWKEVASSYQEPKAIGVLRFTYERSLWHPALYWKEPVASCKVAVVEWKAFPAFSQRGDEIWTIQSYLCRTHLTVASFVLWKPKYTCWHKAFCTRSCNELKPCYKVLTYRVVISPSFMQLSFM